MPIEFTQQPSGGSSHATRLVMRYDGSGRRISKTAMRIVGDDDWDTTLVTHYTGIGTEIREYKPANFTRYTDSAGVEHCVSANPDYGGNASTACPLPDTVKAVIPLPHGLGRYALQDVGQVDENGAPQAFEWYLKNHLGSTMVVYGTGFPDPLGISPEGELRAAYDYRSFGEQLDLLVFTRKVTENFTGKERDDETQLDYFGARYLDPMLGKWISVDPKRQFASPYLYAGNGVNPVNGFDSDGLLWEYAQNSGKLTYIDDKTGVRTLKAIGYAGKGLGKNNANWDNIRGGKNIPNSGPLPAGKYTFGPMIENYITSRGVSLPFTMQLIPDPENEMFGRSGFLAHGDNSTHTASDGCLIFDRAMRKAIDESGDRALQVVPDAVEDMDPEWFGSGNVTVGDPIIEQE
ncbi:RHS repeat-associated core domain-containing protein [Fibrobacter sp. UWCM]|uniref:RHS repeat-associated core domain-containing protein n=1 Tax=Fibrobacter sp. UWCM TaxID=1896208 RepID=UPI00091E6919|nr:RHS repeat-associated core domain-containing protein [Fibrobacter sp. UWCM]SHG71340.1 RHS repeat-associated core domain-containing protein [Fibrobacter sp. UWCM]